MACELLAILPWCAKRKLSKLVVGTMREVAWGMLHSQQQVRLRLVYSLTQLHHECNGAWVVGRCLNELCLWRSNRSKYLQLVGRVGIDELWSV